MTHPLGLWESNNELLDRRLDGVGERGCAVTVSSGDRGVVHPVDPPIPVKAWIHRTRHGWKQVDARADARTASGVRVEYEDEHGRTGLAWLRASSFTRLRPVTRERPAAG